MYAVITLIGTVIDLYIWVILLSVVLSWLVAFNIVNTSNRVVYLIGDILHRLTEPILGPIRRFLPNLGAIDISPVVLILGLYFIRNLVEHDIGQSLIQ